MQVLSIAVVSIILISLVSVASPQNHENYSSYIWNSTLKNYYPFSIKTIEEGKGLTIVIKNNENHSINDLVVNITCLGGWFMFPKHQTILINEINAQAEVEKNIFVFGLGFGLLQDTPLITVSIGYLHYSLIRQISSVVFGPYTKIVGINYNDSASFDGYTLFSPEYGTKTYLMNNKGEFVHDWDSSYIQGFSSYLVENGNLVRTGLPSPNPRFVGGGITGLVEIFDWNNSQIWEFRYSNLDHCLHHDIEVLPNGNILMIAWEHKTAFEAVAAGRDPATLPQNELWPDHIIEVQPTGPSTGEIVWEWHVWDHLVQEFDPSKDNYGVVSEHPELIDINYGVYLGKDRADFNHINSVDYHPEFDQIIVSANVQNEIWVIDHSTTTEEAAGHTGGRYGMGGDILYRWGNPAVYQAGEVFDQQLFGQHDAQWINDSYPGGGHILVFNNGVGRPGGKFSSIDEIILPVNETGWYFRTPGEAFGPKEPCWVYMADNAGEFYANHLSGCQRLPNGNTLICHGPAGFFFEVTSDKEIVWQYLNLLPSMMRNHVANIRRYAPEYPGLDFLDN